MLGGAAAGARSRPPTDQSGLSRFPLYSLFPQAGNRSTIHKVTESLFSTSLSTFGVPTPPPNSPYSPLHLELFNTCSQRLTLDQTDKSDLSKMDDGGNGKLGLQCVQESACCPTDVQRQMLENVTSGMQPLSVKTEQRRGCCVTGSPKKIIHGSDGGCSRTNPVAWVGVAGQNVQVQVKREPQHMHMSELVAVKLEQASPGNKHDHPPTIPASLNNGSIPVGIAVARQRVGDAGLLAALSQKDNQQRMHDIGTSFRCHSAADAAQAAMTVGVANVLCEERPGPLAWPAPPSAAPPAPLWQYPAAQMSMESMMVGGVGVPGVGPGMSSVGGYQLVREPTTGALLLLPAPPDLPHTVVWGTPYSSAPLLLPPPPHPSHHLQLLPGDILASTATLQHTHTHSTRLVTLAPAPQPQAHPHAHQPHSDKRKSIMQPLMPPHALIKIEQEPQEKQPSFSTDPVQQPLLTTHLTYYQPDFQEQACRSQATSPAAPPTPPPEAHESPAHKDASNQTDHIDDDDDDSPNHADDHEREVACIGVAHFPGDQSPTALHSGSIDTEDSSSEGMATSAVVGAVEKAINAIERDDALTDNNSSSGGSHDLVIDTGRNTPVSQPPSSRSHVDLSGLELLSNSIEQFERTTPANSMPSLESVIQPLTIDTRTSTTSKILIKMSPKSPHSTATETQRRFEFPSTETNTESTSKSSLDGLGLLCALAEQRFMEEVEDGSSNVPKTSRPFIKSEPLLSPNDRQRPVERLETKKEHRHSEDSSSSERRRKRSRDRVEKLKYKLEKIRRHNREREERANGGELEASLRRVTACLCGSATCSHTAAVPSAQAIVKAMEKDMRERLQELQRQCEEKRAQLNALTPPLPPLSTPSDPSTPAPSPDSDRGSSQKRKVGRPRKVSSPDSSTETIVAKKPKSKSSLVGFLLAKSKLKGGIVCSRTDSQREEINRTSKVRPKLKAEPILKSKYSEEEESEAGLNRSASSSMESLNEVRQKNREKVDRLVRKHSRDDLPELEFAIRRASASSDSDKDRRRAKKRRKSVKSKDGVSEEKKDKVELVPQRISKCTLTEQLLDTSPRVLTAMGGLFYAGKLSAVQAPDVYAITLDGERGNKPHILSREETLRDAILEINPSSVSEMPPGTRVCAYWSQQYRCLYPGTVAELTSPDRHDEKFVAVEFDDGDSGRIAIEDIRLLEPNYPVVEYENPLFTLSKRRRNTSVNSTEEKKSLADLKPGTSSEIPEKTEEDRHRDKKKLKKHRKDKIKRRHSSEEDPNTADYIKKKKKKHKCCEDHCKHKKHHKKHHRKHRKRHSGCKDHSSSSGDDNQKKSSSDYVDSNKEDSGDSNDRLSTLIAVEKSPDEKMKTVIKKAVLPKTLVKTAVLDFSNIGQSLKKDEEKRDNLKDSGIGLEAETSPSEASKKKTKRRTVSSTSSNGESAAGVSKMAAFLPGGALWRWSGPVYRRTAKPRLKKLFYKAIQRGEETLNVGDAAVFLSTGRPDRPYIGRIEALWEARGAMAVRVRWFYHPEETIGLTDQLHYPGGLFESPHTDENDVQTISHKCEVVPLAQYKERMGDDPVRYSTVYDNNDIYYLAGHYDPTQQILKLEQDIPFAGKSNP